LLVRRVNGDRYLTEDGVAGLVGGFAVRLDVDLVTAGLYLECSAIAGSGLERFNGALDDVAR